MIDKKESVGGNTTGENDATHKASRFRRILRALFSGPERPEISAEKNQRKVLANILLLLTVLVGGGASTFVGFNIGEALSYVAKSNIDLTTREGLKQFVQEYLAYKFNQLYPHIDEGMFITLVDLVDDYGVRVLERVDIHAFLEGSERSQAALLYARYYEDMTRSHELNSMNSQNGSATPTYLERKVNINSVLIESSKRLQLPLSFQFEGIPVELQRTVEENAAVTLSFIMSFLDHDQKLQVERSFEELSLLLEELLKDEQIHNGDLSEELLEKIDKRILSWTISVLFPDITDQESQLIFDNFFRIFMALSYFNIDQYTILLDIFSQLPNSTTLEFAFSLQSASELSSQVYFNNKKIDTGMLKVIGGMVSGNHILSSLQPGWLPFSPSELIKADQNHQQFLIDFYTVYSDNNSNISFAAFVRMFSLLNISEFEKADILQIISNQSFETFEKTILSTFYTSIVLPRVKEILVWSDYDNDVSAYEEVFVNTILNLDGAIDLFLSDDASKILPTIIAKIIKHKADDSNTNESWPDLLRSVTLVSLQADRYQENLFSDFYSDKIFEFINSKYNPQDESNSLIENIYSLREQSPLAFFIAVVVYDGLQDLTLIEADNILNNLNVFADDIFSSGMVSHSFITSELFLATLGSMDPLEFAQADMPFSKFFFISNMRLKGIELPLEQVRSLPDTIELRQWELLYLLIDEAQKFDEVQIEDTVLGLMRIMKADTTLSEGLFLSILSNKERLQLFFENTANIPTDIPGYTMPATEQSTYQSFENEIKIFRFAQYAFDMRVEDTVAWFFEHQMTQDQRNEPSFTSLNSTLNYLLSGKGNGQKMVELINADYEEKIKTLLEDIGLSTELKDQVLERIFLSDNTKIAVTDKIVSEIEGILKNKHELGYINYVFDFAVREEINLQIAISFIKVSLDSTNQLAANWRESFVSYALPFFQTIAPSNFILSTDEPHWNFLLLLNGSVGLAYVNRPEDLDAFGRLILKSHFLFGQNNQLSGSNEDQQLLFDNWKDIISVYRAQSVKALLQFPEIAQGYIQTQDLSLKHDVETLINSPFITNQDLVNLMKSATVEFADSQHPLRVVANFLREPLIKDLSDQQKNLLLTSISLKTRMTVEQNGRLIIDLLNHGLTPEEVAAFWSGQFKLHGELITRYGAQEVRLSEGTQILSIEVNNPLLLSTNPDEAIPSDILLFSALLFTKGLLYDLDGNLIMHQSETSSSDVSEMTIKEFLSLYSNHHFFISREFEDGGTRIEVLKGHELVGDSLETVKLVDLLDSENIETFSLVNVIVGNDISQEDRVYLSGMGSQTGYADFLGVTDEGQAFFISLEDYNNVDEIFKDFPNIILVPIDLGRKPVLSQDLVNSRLSVNPVVIGVRLRP